MESSLRDERHNDPQQGEAISAAVGASDSDRAILRSTAAMRFDELVEAHPRHALSTPAPRSSQSGPGWTKPRAVELGAAQLAALTTPASTARD